MLIKRRQFHPRLSGQIKLRITPGQASEVQWEKGNTLTTEGTEITECFNG